MSLHNNHSEAHQCQWCEEPEDPQDSLHCFRKEPSLILAIQMFIDHAVHVILGGAKTRKFLVIAHFKLNKSAKSRLHQDVKPRTKILVVPINKLGRAYENVV